MNNYNLYYKGSRINQKPITQEDLERIVQINRPIRKMMGKSMEEIPLNKIRVVKCTIV